VAVCDQGQPDNEASEARFVEMLTFHQPDLLAYISSIMIGDSNARDVLQDTNVALWSHRNDFDSRRPFFPWACGFAFNKVLAYRQTRRRSRLLFNDEMLQEISQAYLQESAGSDAQLIALRSCLQKLGQKHRELIHDRYIKNVSVNGLATRLGGTANQISARLYRIRKALADCIQKVLATEPH
jgi:RNA polymerase sigma-70 factor, ECF subfamily